MNVNVWVEDSKRATDYFDSMMATSLDMGGMAGVTMQPRKACAVEGDALWCIEVVHAKVQVWMTFIVPLVLGVIFDAVWLFVLSGLLYATMFFYSPQFIKMVVRRGLKKNDVEFEEWYSDEKTVLYLVKRKGVGVKSAG
jgi:hypothetical protein